MNTSSRWAEKLGLATAPLFGGLDAISPTAEHHVMLDGGREASRLLRSQMFQELVAKLQNPIAAGFGPLTFHITW